MADVRVLVLRAAGINCDEEVMHCWQRVGAKPTLLHINTLVQAPDRLDDFSIVTIPGGFSYGDDIAAGTILAQRITHELAGPLGELVDRGGGILGICNGFQVLVKVGLLPGGPESRSRVTITFNDSARFEARWVRLEVCANRCPFLTPIEPPGTTPPSPPAGDPRSTILEMPVEHAEGKVVTASDTVTRELLERGQVAVRYVDENGRYDVYPANPNGSVAGIAGLCDATGRILGLMPHPDRHFALTHHPMWPQRNRTATPDGLTLFQNAMRYWGRC